MDNKFNLSEDEFALYLTEALMEKAEKEADSEDESPEVRVRTFQELMVLTDNAGVVVKLGEAEFHVTIVRSK